MEHKDAEGNFTDPGFNPSDATQTGPGDADEYDGEMAEAKASGGYGSMKKDELVAEADSRGLDYASDATKADLVAALEADDAE